MLTKLTIRNFKRFSEASVELGKAVVFIGPNNSGKTTALQSLALWEIGLRSWLAKRGGKASPQKRPGVTINRRDLISIPIPAADLLWHELHVRDVQKMQVEENSKKRTKTTSTKNVRVDVIVEGVSEDKAWNCGLEFDYSNEESFFCRPIRLPGYEDVQVSDAKFSSVPEEAKGIRVAYLPPMSGLADREFIKQPGEIGFLIGQGQTAQTLRNICFQVFSSEDRQKWRDIVDRIQSLFGVKLRDPQYIHERSEITMDYIERNTRLDLSSAGRGLQQTLLLLAYLYANPNTVLLIDEPDAHLEILRQRQIYQLLTSIADTQGSQVVAASHSEVVLGEAAGRGKVVAFVGKPHTINDRGSQLMKSLTDIGWDLYYQAESMGWILFLEGATDLAILQAFAQTLGHDARDFLDRPFVHYVATNLPQKARDLFFGLREAKSDLSGIAIFDRLEQALKESGPLVECMWRKREIENYFCTKEVLLEYARGVPGDDLFSHADSGKRLDAMQAAIREVETALLTLGKPEPWSADVKATEDFLDPVFRTFFAKLQLPITLRKTDYHELAKLVKKDRIDSEIREKLDLIVKVARKARP